jgi:hypothetical protein
MMVSAVVVAGLLPASVKFDKSNIRRVSGSINRTPRKASFSQLQKTGRCPDTRS